MKKLVLLFAALLVAGCGEKSSSEGSESLSDADVERLVKDAVDFDSLEEREGLYCQTNESKPFSGWAKVMIGGNVLLGLGQWKDGKRDGLQRAWYGNGQKMDEQTFKDGELVGLQTAWHDNGQKMDEVTFKDGELVGLATKWHENGQKRSEATYKDGEKRGLWTEWYENGQKRSEATYKDGKQDGLWTEWGENGQKKAEGTLKDGEKLSTKYWNAKGEEVETLEEAGK